MSDRDVEPLCIHGSMWDDGSSPMVPISAGSFLVVGPYLDLQLHRPRNERRAPEGTPTWHRVQQKQHPQQPPCLPASPPACVPHHGPWPCHFLVLPRFLSRGEESRDGTAGRVQRNDPTGLTSAAAAPWPGLACEATVENQRSNQSCEVRRWPNRALEDL